MKKSVHKKKLTKRNKSETLSVVRIRYVSIGLGLIALIITGNQIYSATNNVHVLGTSTSNLLARGGDDTHEDSESSEQHSDNNNSGSNNSNTSTNSNSNSNSPTTDKQSSSSTNSVNSPSLSTKVDCIGPDGKHFVTSFHDCQELNVKWNNTNFKFTVVEKSSSDDLVKTAKSTDSKEKSKQKTTSLEVKTENKKTELHLENNDNHIEIKKEDDGKLHISSKNEEGTEAEIEDHDAIKELNESLKDHDIEIGTGSATKFTFRTGKVETHTDFPLSINPSTNQLSVTTPSGTHDLTILPDHAIQNLLDLKVFSNILSTADSNTASAEASNKVIELTEIDNKAAFEIDGVSNKKLLGLFPVAFTKKVFVSPDNGKILKTQQPTFDTILERISF